MADMSQKESETAATGIIFKISVICGCQLPTHDAHINALEAEFLTFLHDFGYYSLTAEEILVAFRMNAAFKLRERVEVYGAIFNIDYASKVLMLYMEDRHRLDRKLSEKMREIKADEQLEQEANVRRRKVKAQFSLFMSGVDMGELDLTDCFMQLDQDGAYLKRNSEERFMKPLPRGLHVDNFTRLSQWGERMEARFQAGKLAVIDLFEAMKKTGKNEIYTEDLKLIHKDYDLPEEVVVPADPIEDLPF